MAYFLFPCFLAHFHYIHSLSTSPFAFSPLHSSFPPFHLFTVPPCHSLFHSFLRYSHLLPSLIQSLLILLGLIPSSVFSLSPFVFLDAMISSPCRFSAFSLSFPPRPPLPPGLRADFFLHFLLPFLSFLPFSFISLFCCSFLSSLISSFFFHSSTLRSFLFFPWFVRFLFRCFFLLSSFVHRRSFLLSFNLVLRSLASSFVSFFLPFTLYLFLLL